MKLIEPRSLPILAADPVAVNIREGRQRQHRQPMRWQPVFRDDGQGYCLFSGSRHPRHSKHYDDPEHFRQGAAIDFAPWRVGDSLYIREAWALVHFSVNPETGWVEGTDAWTDRAPKERPKSHWEPVYRAGGAWDRCVEGRGFRWRPNILCPEWAARTRTKPLVRVWAERVLDTSEADARAEGFMSLADYQSVMDNFYPGCTLRNDWLWCCAWDGVEVQR